MLRAGITVEYQLQVDDVFSVRFETRCPVGTKPSIESQYLWTRDDDDSNWPAETQHLFVAEIPAVITEEYLTAATNRLVPAISSKLRLLCRAETRCFSQSFALRSRHPGLAKEPFGRPLPEEAVSRASCPWRELP